ncbi:MAG TPA: hypothetical protein VLD39_09580 [Gammaproteobacteria bacterium]|nr:hypothetical protein [Gammaproteobacteria bacterium]
MRAAPARVQSHPPSPASPESTKPSLPGFKEPPSGKRRVAPKPEPKQERGSAPESQPSTTEQATQGARTPSIEEVENDPLVKSVLDVFEGEIKRVHPKN